MSELQHCPECGSTMARIFKPKPGYRCIVCWKFYPDNPDIPSLILTGVTMGTSVALAHKAIEAIQKENPQQINILYRKIKQRFPDLDYQTFLEAYDIAVQESKKPKFIVKKADIIPTPEGSYIAVAKPPAHLLQRLEEIQKKVQELTETIGFRYDNMGYADTKSIEQRKRLWKERDEIQAQIRELQEQQVEAKGIYRIMKRNVIVRDGKTNYNFPYSHGIVKPPKYMSATDVQDKLGFWMGIECGFDTFIEEIERAGYKRAQGTNPESTHELYETFHGVPVDKTFKAKIPDPMGELEYVAKIDHLVYICQGKKAVGDDEGEDISYIHKWKKAKMLLARDENKNYFIVGKCKVIKSGVNDWKGKPTWSKNNPKVRIPKKVTYLGLLPEIKAGGKVYRFTDTILCTDSKGQHLYITELTRSQPTHPEA